MKLTQNNSPIQMDAYIKKLHLQRQQQNAQQRDNSQKGTVDRAQLSDQAENVRDEKLRQVKLDIEKGTYRVNPAKVANEMLREAFENDNLLKNIDTRDSTPKR